MSQENHLDDLASEFFRDFSRVEYALKASGYNYGEGPAEADWHRFATALESFVEAPSTLALKEAIEFVLREPPKKQYIEGGQLQWRSAPPTTSSKADILFLYIRRVRNNLFHGGKFNGHWFAPERSEQLLRASLLILRSAVEAEPKVREAFHG